MNFKEKTNLYYRLRKLSFYNFTFATDRDFKKIILSTFLITLLFLIATIYVSATYEKDYYRVAAGKYGIIENIMINIFFLAIWDEIGLLVPPNRSQTL